ncbi:uncharacterized protein LOC117784649 [Drosophila innubila]|uniref:uncharacterized protein LOC117784649 n=1 Tax=Drosophila innubila TaxID=198719 RepID=UPI00148BE317|nr:uncharacterized protein LOC117784649 [Drosophila innubila]
MPNRQVNSWRYSRVMMTMLRCLLAVSYLWAMVSAAAVVPVLHGEKSTWLFWMTTVQYSLTYTSLLPFDGFTQGYILLVVIQMLTRLYQCCRCSFFGTSTNQNNVHNANIGKYDKRLLTYFGPYLVLFIISWLASIFYTSTTVLQIYHQQPTRNQTVLYCELAMVIIFKVLVLTNAIVRCLRGLIILKLFKLEPERNLRNYHNFGEHLNLFFQY